MYTHSHYVMRDQVKGVIPELMRFDSRGRRRLRGSFTELALFAGAITVYLVALGLSN